MRETAIIETIRRLNRTKDPQTGLVVGIGDDCAVWRPRSDWETIVTTDQVVEGVHYSLGASGSLVAARLVGRGLSDIAAMGGEPRVAFLNVAWPRTLKDRWRTAFLQAFGREAGRWKVAWAGGDISSTLARCVASITVIGEVPHGQALLRSGAHLDDLLYVSGVLGRSSQTIKRITPRLELGRRLRGIATACIDLSDGLSTDLHHLCEQSGVGAVVDPSRIPRAGSLDRALNAGEDYELLFTARPSTRMPPRLVGLKITCIGRINRGHRVMLGGQPLEPRGWEHR